MMLVNDIFFKYIKSCIKKKKINKYKNLTSKNEIDVNDKKIDNDNKIKIISFLIATYLYIFPHHPILDHNHVH